MPQRSCAADKCPQRKSVIHISAFAVCSVNHMSFQNKSILNRFVFFVNYAHFYKHNLLHPPHPHYSLGKNLKFKITNAV